MRKIILIAVLLWMPLFVSGVEIAELIAKLEKALEAYEKDVGAYPSTRQGLEALARRPITVNPEKWKGPYLEEIPTDPWGEEFIYRFPGENDAAFDLISPGPDRTADTKDDISSSSGRGSPVKPVPLGSTPPPPLPYRNSSKDYIEKAGGLNSNMVWIEPGKFVFGSHTTRYGPPLVTMDGYWIGKHEITARQYCIFLNAVEDPEKLGYILVFPGSTYMKKEGTFVPRPGCGNKPAYPVSWTGADAFCRMLSEGTGKKYDLPTEAQWERAARGGLRMKSYPWGEDHPEGRANFGKNSEQEHEILMPVGSFPPNPYGLHDMAGNVMEWCRDWFRKDAELDGFTNPEGPPGGIEKVLKGGSVLSHDRYLRVGLRFHNLPWQRPGGFRLVREP